MQYEESVAYRLKQIGLNIAYYRKLKGLKQEELAEKAGMERSAISHLEVPTIYSNPTAETIIRVADALEIEPYELITFRK